MSDSKHNPKLERFSAIMDENAQKWDVARAMGVTEQGFKAAHPELEEMSRQVDKRVMHDIAKGAAATGATAIAATAIPILLRKKINAPTWAKALIATTSGGVGATAGGYVSAKTFGIDALDAIADYHAAENNALALEIGRQAPKFAATHEQVMVVSDNGFADRTPNRSDSHADQVDADKHKHAHHCKA